MSDFSSVTKYQTLVPASKDMSSSEKYTTLVPARDIHRLETQIMLETHEETGESHTAPAIRFQYNIDAGANCRISNYKWLRNLLVPRQLLRSFICLRWKDGDTVVRYHLNTRGVTYNLSASLYANEIVPRYFVIEVWSYTGTTWGVEEDIPINLALLTVSTSPDDTDYSQLTAPTPVASELLIDMPADIPITMDAAGPYTSN